MTGFELDTQGSWDCDDFYDYGNLRRLESYRYDQQTEPIHVMTFCFDCWQ